MWFKFKGVALESFGVLYNVSKYPVVASPRWEEVEVPGRSGSYKFPLGYEDRVCVVEILIRGLRAQRKVKVDSLLDFFSGVGSVETDATGAMDMCVFCIESNESVRLSERLIVTFKSV